MLQLPFEFYALDFAALLIWNDFTMQRLIRRFPWARPTGTGQIVPPELKPRFFHLYGDIGWYGLSPVRPSPFLLYMLPALAPMPIRSA